MWDEWPPIVRRKSFFWIVLWLALHAPNELRCPAPEVACESSRSARTRAAFPEMFSIPVAIQISELWQPGSMY